MILIRSSNIVTMMRMSMEINMALKMMLMMMMMLMMIMMMMMMMMKMMKMMIMTINKKVIAVMIML